MKLSELKTLQQEASKYDFILDYLRPKQFEYIKTLIAMGPALVSLIEAAKKMEGELRHVDDGFFTNLIPPEFFPVLTALKALEEV